MDLIISVLVGFSTTVLISIAINSAESIKKTLSRKKQKKVIKTTQKTKNSSLKLYCIK